MNLFKKALTTLTAIATIAWSVGLSAFVPTAHALTTGSLIKTSSNAGVYYYGGDGKRYVFPNESTYKSWYSDFSNVTTVTTEEMGGIEFGGNVTMRPGVKLVQFNTVPKVYAVAKDGTLRWIETEAIATALYGANWGSMIVGIHESLVDNYSYGASIANANDYSPSAATAGSPSINVDKNLGGSTQTNPTPATGGALTVSLATDSPAGQSVPAGSTAPASNVVFTKINLSAGSNAVIVNKVTVTRSGLSTDASLAAVKLWNGATQLDTAQTLNSSHQASFNVNTTIAANSTLSLTVSGDLACIEDGAVNCVPATNVNANNEIKFGIAANTDISSNASSVSGAPVYGNTFVTSNVNVGSLTISKGAQMPSVGSTYDIGDDKVVFAARLEAGSVEDVKITSVTLESGDRSTIQTGDVSNLRLINDTTGQTLATIASLDAKGNAVFDLSSNPLLIAKGNTRDLTLKAKVENGASRIIGFDIHDNTSFLLKAVGANYGFGVEMSNGTADWDSSVAGNQVGTGVGVTINQGTLTVSKASTSPTAGNIAKGGSDINVGEFAFEVKGENIRIGTTVVNFDTTDVLGSLFTAGACSTIFDNVKLVDVKTGVVLAGPVTPTGAIVAGPGTTADDCIATFSSSYELSNGANTVKVLINTTSAIPNNSVLLAQVSGAGFANVKGLTSNKAITPTPSATDVAANNQTVKGATLAAQMGATPLAGSIVKGKISFPVAYVGMDASVGGEDVRISQIKLTNNGGAGVSDVADSTDYVNARLINVATGAQVGTTVQPVDIDGVPDGNNTVTFTFSGDELVVLKTAQVNLALQIDVLSTVATNEDFGFTVVTAATDFTGTGKASATSAVITATGTSPTQNAIAGGSLKVTLDADTAISAQLVSSSTGNNVVSYKFESVDEAIDVTEVYLVGARSDTAAAVSTGWGSNIMSLEAYVNGVKIGSTLSAAADGIQLLSLPAGALTIPKNGSKVLTIKANMHNKTNLVTTDAAIEYFRVGIANDTAAGAGFGTTWQGMAGAAADGYLITATGQDSGATIATNTINSTGVAGGLVYGGNLFSAHDGVLTVTLNASSPSGLKVASTSQELIRLNLTATGDDIAVTGLTAPITDTCAAIAGASTLKSVDNTVTYDTALALTGAFIAIPSLSVAAGTTKVVKSETNTTGCVNPETVQQNVTAITYQATDTIAVDGSGVQTKELPVNGGAISY